MISSRLKLGFHLLIFFAVTHSLVVRAGAIDDHDVCNQYLSYAEVYDLDAQIGHDARIIGDEVNAENLRRTVMEITGRLPLDKKGTIRGRYTEEQRARVVNYLVREGERLGVETYVEEDVQLRRVMKKKLFSESGNNNDIPFNLKSTDFKYLRKYWEHHSFRDFRKLLVHVEELEDSPLTFRELDLEYLTQLEDDLIRRGNREFVWETKGKYFKEKHRLNPKWALVDLQDLIERISLWETMSVAEREKYETELYDVSYKRVANVVMEIPGTEWPHEIIEASAHYDTTSPEKPGADDNGSGVATLIEMARIFSKFPPKRTIRLVFADLEERGKDGTWMHVRRAVERGDQILGAVVVDTIAYHPIGRRAAKRSEFVVEVGVDEKHSSELSYEASRKMADVMVFQSERYSDRFVKSKVETYGALPGTADHGPYWETGVPAVLVAAIYKHEYINPGYHKADDVVERFNWGFFEGIVKFVVEGVAVLAWSSLDRELEEALDDRKQEYYNRVVDWSFNSGESRTEPQKKSWSAGSSYSGGSLDTYYWEKPSSKKKKESQNSDDKSEGEPEVKEEEVKKPVASKPKRKRKRKRRKR